MDTGSMLLDLFALLLVVGVVGYAMWPPHYHRYIYLIGQTVHKGKSCQITECVCGSQLLTPVPLSNEEKNDDHQP
jgi:hypothetical protein